MNKRIARALRNRLAPLSAVVITFATITVVPAATTMLAAAGATAAHQAKAVRMDFAPPKFQATSHRSDRTRAETIFVPITR
jgi:hypothetical protein